MGEPTPSPAAGAAARARAALGGAPGAGSAGALPLTGQVFLGYSGGPGEDAHDRGSKGMKKKYGSVIEGKAAYYDMSDPERSALATALYRSGIVKDPGDFDAVQKAWEKAVDDAAGFYRSGRGREVTPWEIIGMKISAMTQSAAGSGGQPRSSTSTSYNVPSPLDAEAGVKAIFASAVGRDPTKDEVAKYTALMTGLAKKNPSTSTTTYDASGNATTTSSGGIDAAGLRQGVTDKLQETSEYGAYQAATTYYNLLQNAISAPG